LRIGGEGEGGLRGRGDLYVEVRVEPHPVFQRDGGNLLLDYPMHIDQAALGADVELPTMNGRVSMKIPAGTQSGTVFRVRGKGVPDLRDGRPGDLLVRVAIETPTNLSGKQRQLLQELGKSFEDDAQHPSRRSFLDRLRDVLLKKS